MYPIRQLLPFMYLNFSLFCSRHTNEHKYSHMPLSDKAEKWDEVDRITSAAYSLDSVLPVLTSGPPTQTPGNTGTVFSIKKKKWETKFLLHQTLELMSCGVWDSLLSALLTFGVWTAWQFSNRDITGFNVKMCIMTAARLHFPQHQPPHELKHR